MSAHCCSPAVKPPGKDYRRVLWIALAVNAGMFALELAAGLGAQSTSLLADALDFFGDAANYAISLFVLAMAASARSRAALFKGWTMGIYGAFILARAAYGMTTGAVPEAATMGLVGALALLANGVVAVLLYRFRDGDANMRSVWLCTRNDMIGNLAVLLAALGVFGTGAVWPDAIVAAIMGGLGLSAAISVIRHARSELGTGYHHATNQRH
jgi:Co/Zn/Cd efflux system component